MSSSGEKTAARKKRRRALKPHSFPDPSRPALGHRHAAAGLLSECGRYSGLKDPERGFLQTPTPRKSPIPATGDFFSTPDCKLCRFALRRKKDCGGKPARVAFKPARIPLYKKHNAYARQNRPTAHFPYGQSLYNPLRKNIPATPITRLLRRHILFNIIRQLSPDITPVFRPCHFGKIKTGTEKKISLLYVGGL